MEAEHHPVWTLYDNLRTARLNAKYYGRRLAAVQLRSTMIEAVILVTAPTSAIAGLWFWQTEIGRFAWQCLGVAAACAAILKPLCASTKRIKEYENTLVGYRTLEFDLIEIKCLVEQQQKYNKTLQVLFADALHRARTLAEKAPEASENERMKRKCEREVLQELPASSFFVPGD